MNHLQEIATARAFIETQPVKGPIAFCALSGAHMYGFESPDSDLDLKGAYLAPTSALLGLDPLPKTFDRTERYLGVECDITLLELGKALTLLVVGNGNIAEQISSPFQITEGDTLGELRRLLPGVLSKRFARHYRGFLKGKRRDFERTTTPEVKDLLYGFRVAATGAHLLLTGEVNADLSALAPLYQMSEVPELIARKRQGLEHGRLTAAEARTSLSRWDSLEALIEDAMSRSVLPERATDVEALSRWLVDLRVNSLR